MPKIMIVDDHPAVARAAAALVNVVGCETRIEHSGPAAIDALRSDAVDLVLLDVSMPGMSGIEVLRRLAAEGLTSQLPVVMFSAAVEQVADEALKLGAVDVILKGEPDLLLKGIRRHLPQPPPAPSSPTSP